MKNCWISFSRQGVLLMKYSLPPSRNTLRVIVTSLYAISTPAARRLSSSTPPIVSDTSAMPNGLRPSVPLKITSAISPPRSAFADCSPSTQRIASDTFDLPHPLGPTMAVTPGRKFSDVLSAKDLKPRTVKFLRYMIFVYNKLNTPFCKVQNHYIKGSVHCRSTTCGEEPR